MIAQWLEFIPFENQWHYARKAFHSSETKYGLGFRSFLFSFQVCYGCPLLPKRLISWAWNTFESHSRPINTFLRAASGALVWTSLYLDALSAGLLQQFDSSRVRCLLAAAVVPGQVAASGATRQLVAQLLSRHRVLQGGTAKTEAGRRWEKRKEGEKNRKREAEGTLISTHSVLSLFGGFAYTLSMN